jgi:hypothetical protein
VDRLEEEEEEGVMVTMLPILFKRNLVDVRF